VALERFSLGFLETCDCGLVHLSGGPSWELSSNAGMSGLAFALAVRESVDLPVYDADIPEPLIPAPAPMRLRLSRATRLAAAGQWASWWDLLVAQAAAGHIERSGGAGRAPMWVADPPKFASLAASPELQHIVTSALEPLRAWGESLEVPRDPVSNPVAGFVAHAESRLGRPVKPFAIRLEVLPVAGTRHWNVVLAPDLVRAHSLVSADFGTEPDRHGDWLVGVITQIG